MNFILRSAAVAVSSLFILSFASAQTPVLTTEQVLQKMEKANADYPSLQANIERRKYVAFINDLADPQVGQIWIQHSGTAPRQIKIEFTKPVMEELHIDKGVFRHYYPGTNSGEVKNFDKDNQAEGECVLLGLCQYGAGVQKHFDARVAGQETINGVPTVKLELKSKDTKVTKGFALITLWLDTTKWLPVQTRVTEENRNYVEARFSQMKTAKFSDSVFKFDFPKNAHINKLP